MSEKKQKTIRWIIRGIMCAAIAGLIICISVNFIEAAALLAEEKELSPDYNTVIKSLSTEKSRNNSLSSDIAGEIQRKKDIEVQIEKTKQQLDTAKEELTEADAILTSVKTQIEEDEKEEKAYIEAHANDIAVGYSASGLWFKNQAEVEKILKQAGFKNISKKVYYDIVFGVTEEGEVDKVVIGGKSDFKADDKFDPSEKVEIYYHSAVENDPEYQASHSVTPTPVPESSSHTTDSNKCFYSSNTYDVAKKGNKGIFSYVKRARDYEVYYIIDFDSGCVYYFTSDDSSCMRMKNISGDLNNGLKVNYNDNGTKWTETLHFHYWETPNTLIMVDHNGFDYKFSATDLDAALALKKNKEITDY